MKTLTYRKRSASWRDQGPAWLLAALVVLAALGGGASRADVLSLLYLRPLAVILAATGLLLWQTRFDWDLVRQPLMLFLALATLMLIQLVPLPPGIWMHLPGHGLFVEAATIAGAPQPWRPISIDPPSTWNALAALSVPMAGLLLAGLAGPIGRDWLGLLVIGVAIATALVAMLQVVLGPESAAYTYRAISRGIPSGLFSNRNHQAALLAAAMPFVGQWIAQASPERQGLHVAIGIGLLLLFAAGVAVSGSRAGLVLALLGLGVAMLICGRRLGRGLFRSRSRGVFVAVGLAALMLMGAAAFVLAQGQGVSRLTAMLSAGAEEQRFVLLPVIWVLAVSYLPFGCGFGAFDPAYRIVEADTALHLTYFNHAHDDLLELLVTGGFPAMLLLVAALIWGAISVRRHLTKRTGGRNAIVWYAPALSLVVFLLLASLVDYPLRTPLASLLFALCWAYLSAPMSSRQNLDGQSALRP